MVQWILNKLFNKVDIMRSGVPGAPLYLRRWFIYPLAPKDLAMVPRTYLHRFSAGDDTQILHDHPWPFSSIILWGGYWEHSYNPEYLKWHALIKYVADKVEEHKVKPLSWTEQMDVGLKQCVILTGEEPVKTVKKWYGPGSFLKRGASWTHAVELAKDHEGNDKACWSLVRTGIKCRSWGFHTDNGWCWWRNFHAGACVCYDNPNETIPGVK